MDERDVYPEHLIELVKNTPVIWDRTSEDYKKRQETEDAWRNICRSIWSDYDLLDHTEQKHLGQLVKKKWNNIRDHWQKRCKRVEAASKDGHPPFKLKRYVFQHLLQFLVDGDQSLHDDSAPDHNGGQCKPEFIRSQDSSMKITTSAFPNKYKRRRTDEVMPSEQVKPFEDRHLMFFKGVTPSLRDFTEEQTIDFQLGVLKLIRAIKNPVPHSPNEPTDYPGLNLRSQQQLVYTTTEPLQKTNATPKKNPTKKQKKGKCIVSPTPGN